LTRAGQIVYLVDMDYLCKRLPFLCITLLLLINLSGIVVFATALPSLADERACAESCCPGSASQDEPDGKCNKLECQCSSCVSIDLQRYSLTLRFIGEDLTVSHETSSLPPGDHPQLIDYPPETA
jgi:hypothetical protein